MFLTDERKSNIIENLKKKFTFSEYYFFNREYDDSVEVLGKVDDPNYDIRDFEGREFLFPKKWVTLEVIHE